MRTDSKASKSSSVARANAKWMLPDMGRGAGWPVQREAGGLAQAAVAKALRICSSTSLALTGMGVPGP